MRLTNLLAIATALSMAAAPALATPNPAAKLSLTARDAQEGGAGGGPPARHGASVALIAGVAVAAVVLGAVALSHHDSKAASP